MLSCRWTSCAEYFKRSVLFSWQRRVRHLLALEGWQTPTVWDLVLIPPEVPSLLCVPSRSLSFRSSAAAVTGFEGVSHLSTKPKPQLCSWMHLLFLGGVSFKYHLLLIGNVLVFYIDNLLGWLLMSSLVYLFPSEISVSLKSWAINII